VIIVFGNPRAGTTSVAAALTEMGYNTLHSCIISDSNADMAIRDLYLAACGNSGHNAVVSWRLTPYYTQLHKIYTDAKVDVTFIYCHRSSGWECSMNQFGFSKEKIKEFKDRTKEFLTEICPVSFLNTWSFDISKHGYFELVKILQYDDFDATRPFPHTNKSENVFDI